MFNRILEREAERLLSLCKKENHKYINFGIADANKRRNIYVFHALLAAKIKILDENPSFILIDTMAEAKEIIDNMIFDGFTRELIIKTKIYGTWKDTS